MMLNTRTNTLSPRPKIDPSCIPQSPTAAGKKSVVGTFNRTWSVPLNLTRHECQLLKFIQWRVGT